MRSQTAGGGRSIVLDEEKMLGHRRDRGKPLGTTVIRSLGKQKLVLRSRRLSSVSFLFRSFFSSACERLVCYGMVWPLWMPQQRALGLRDALYLLSRKWTRARTKRTRRPFLASLLTDNYGNEYEDGVQRTRAWTWCEEQRLHSHVDSKFFFIRVRK